MDRDFDLPVRSRGGAFVIQITTRGNQIEPIERRVYAKNYRMESGNNVFIRFAIFLLGQPIRRTNLNSFFLSLFFFPLLLKNKLDSVFNAMRGAQMVENSWQAKLASSRVEQTSWNKTTRIIRLSSNSKKADRLLYYRGKEKVKLNLCINRIKGRG